MATIIRRDGKKGVSYKIQVVIKDIGLGKKVLKSTTWKPSQGMTDKEIERAVTVFSDEFERAVKESYKTAEEDKGNINITFRELSKKWIERGGKTFGLSYDGLNSQRLEKVLPLIGGYKIKDITPSIVQSVFDKIDGLKNRIYVIYPKPNLKEILRKNGLDFAKLRKTELNCKSISDIYNGQRVGIKFATMFAEVCKIDKNKLFDITLKEEPYAKTTIKGFKSVIYNVLAYAVRLCIVKDNYASSKYVDMGKRVSQPVRCMTEDELSRFYEALLQVKNIQWRVSVMTILMTGMRRGEACGLNWEDVDLEKGKIHIVRSYSEVPRHGIVLKEPKTEKSKRTISIPELLIEELKAYKCWYDQQRELWGDAWIESGSVFIQRNGTRVHPANIKMWVTKTCKLAGIQHFSVHSLRHTNITLQIMAGVPIVTVAGRAGHSRASTTTDVYAYYISSSDQRAAETLNNIFTNAGGR